METFVAFGKSLYHLTVIHPLKKLYMHGPSNFLLSFWEGKQESTICAEMTNYDELFWAEHAAECHQLISRRFHSFLVTTHCVMYFSLMLFCISLALDGLRSCCKKARRVNSPRYMLVQSPYRFVSENQ